MTNYEAAFHFQAGSEDFYNVVHFNVTGDVPLDLQDLTDEICTLWANNMANRIAPAISFVGIVWRLDIDGSIGTEFTPTGGPKPGTAGDNQYAGQLAVLVQKRTNGLVRPVLGRAFVMGVTAEGLDANGQWTQGVATSIQVFWDNIKTVVFDGNGQAVMQLKASNPEAPNTNPYNTVNECRALLIPSVLQSRKKGRGA